VAQLGLLRVFKENFTKHNCIHLRLFTA